MKAEDRKCQQQAKQEKCEMTKMEKAKVAAIKALVALRPKRNVHQPRRIAKILESDSESSKEMSMYSSSEDSNKELKSKAKDYECWKFS